MLICILSLMEDLLNGRSSRCLASAVTPRFLGGPDAPSFGMSLGQQFGETGTWALGSAMGVVLFIVSFIVIAAMALTINLKRSGFTGMGAK